VYQDPASSDVGARAQQSQRCPACGHVEADPWARFCGTCGGQLGAGAGGAGAGGRHAPGVPPVPAYQSPPPAYSPLPAYHAGPAAPAGQAEPIAYTIPSIGYGGPARIGAAVSAAFTLLPSVLLAFAGVALIHRARDLLDSWRTATIPVPVPLVTVNLNMNFIDLLNLHQLHDRLVYWDERLWLAFALLWLVPWVVWIVSGALFGVLMALIYNIIAKLGGGMRVALQPSVRPVDGQAVPAANWPPQAQQPGWPPPPGR
jgi:hypothetical protein